MVMPAQLKQPVAKIRYPLDVGDYERADPFECDLAEQRFAADHLNQIMKDIRYHRDEPESLAEIMKHHLETYIAHMNEAAQSSSWRS